MKAASSAGTAVAPRNGAKTKSKSNSSTIIGEALPNIPWEDRPSNDKNVVWRYSGNPVIPRSPHVNINSVFNSAVVPYKGKFAGVFRCDDTRRNMQIHFGRSDDGYNWELEADRIQFTHKDPEIAQFDYAYDPRVVWIEDRYYVTWCNGYHGPTIGMGWTKDFKTFNKMENSLLPFNRNGVLFPRKINGKYLMLSRPSDNGHTPFGDIFISQSPDMIHWGCHRYVMGRRNGWESTKIGAGPIPIETREGWLMFYHGVLTSCNGFVYSYSAALLDIDEPWKVIARCEHYLMNPREIYELAGDVPNVTFPCAALTDAPSGRIAIYYGAADTVTGLAFCQVDEVIDFVKKNSSV